jgi:hypothetical protein
MQATTQFLSCEPLCFAIKEKPNAKERHADNNSALPIGCHQPHRSGGSASRPNLSMTTTACSSLGLSGAAKTRVVPSHYASPDSIL